MEGKQEARAEAKVAHDAEVAAEVEAKEADTGEVLKDTVETEKAETVEISDENGGKLENLIEELEENEDVQEIFHNGV